MLDRAYGCLAGAAIGDVMGMPLCFFSREKIKETYGSIDDFLEGDTGITDDTQEAMIIAGILIRDGKFSKEAFCVEMKKWALENDMLESELIGPSTRKYLTALIEGKKTEEGAKTADTNGSAMRIAPIGVKYWYDFDLCKKVAAESSMPSHASAAACAAACAVACACAAGIRGGASPGRVIEESIIAAKYGETIGFDNKAPKISERVALAVRIVDENRGKGQEAILDELVRVIGAGMKAYESAPLSLGVLYLVNGCAQEGILAAVNAGDDADTNGAICGAICGAFSGAKALPEPWIARAASKSSVDFRQIASQLLKK